MQHLKSQGGGGLQIIPFLAHYQYGALLTTDVSCPKGGRRLYLPTSPVKATDVFSIHQVGISWEEVEDVIYCMEFNFPTEEHNKIIWEQSPATQA